VSKNDRRELRSYDDVAHSLEDFQLHRQARAEATFEIACKVTRLEALKGPVEKFLSLYLIPHSGELLATKLAASTIGSEKLDFLPDPERSFTGSMAFNQRYGVGREESLLKRAMLALPLLLIGYFCHTRIQAIMRQPKVISSVITSLTNGKLDFSPSHEANLASSYYGGIPWLEQTFRPLVVIFAPSILNISESHHLQVISFLADLAPILLIWLFESDRRANTFTSMRSPLFFGIASQLYGIGSIGPLYLFLHYVQSPLSSFAAFDQRLVNVAAASAALPALALAYGLPTLTMFFTPDSSMQLRANAVWQLFPVWLSISHFILRKFTVKDTTQHDRIYQPTTDLPYIRFAMRALAVVSALTFNWVRWQSSFSLSTVFLRNAFTPPATLDLVTGAASLLKIDHLLFVLSCFIWLALLFKDLKEAGIMTVSWVRLIAYAVLCIFVCGPGAGIAMGWQWREEMLASKRAIGAVVRTAEH
jgi:hypothetical protein